MISAVNIVENSNMLSAKLRAEPAPSAQNIMASLPEFAQIAPPYISPFVRVDSKTQQAVLMLRETESGEVLRQYPTKKELMAYSRSQAVDEAAFQQRVVEMQVGDDRADSVDYSNFTSDFDFAPVEVATPTPAPAVGGSTGFASGTSIGGGDTSSFNPASVQVETGSSTSVLA